MRTRQTASAVTVLLLAFLTTGCGKSPPSHPKVSRPQSPVSTQSASPTSPTGTQPPKTSVASVLTSWQLSAMRFISPRVGWVALAKYQSAGGNVAGVRVYQTTDGGASWTAVSRWSAQNAPWASAGQPLSPIGDLSFSSKQNGWGTIFLGAGACQAEWRVIQTRNGGKTWNLSGIVMATDGPSSLAANGSSGWLTNSSCAASATYLYRSEKNGQRWTQVQTFQSPLSSRPMAMSTTLRWTSSTTGFMVNAYGAASSTQPLLALQCLETRNGGANWTSTPIAAHGLTGTVNALSFSSPSNGWVVLSDKNHATLETTQTGGQTWNAVTTVSLGTTPLRKPLIDKVNSMTGYVVSRQGSRTNSAQSLWETTDNGVSWHMVNLPHPDGS